MRRQTNIQRIGNNLGFWRTAALVVGGTMIAVLFAGYQHPLVSATQPISVAVLDYAIPSSAPVSRCWLASRRPRSGPLTR